MTRRAPRQYPAASAVGDLGSAKRGPFREVSCAHPWWVTPLSWLMCGAALCLVLWPITWGVVALVDCR